MSATSTARKVANAAIGIRGLPSPRSVRGGAAVGAAMAASRVPIRSSNPVHAARGTGLRVSAPVANPRIRVGY